MGGRLRGASGLGGPRRPRVPGASRPHLQHALILLGADVHSFDSQRRGLRPALGRLHLFGGHSRSVRRLLRELGLGRAPNPLGRRPVCTGRGRRLAGSDLRYGLQREPSASCARGPKRVRPGSGRRWVASGRESDWSRPTRREGLGGAGAGARDAAGGGGGGEVSGDGGGRAGWGSSAVGAVSFCWLLGPLPPLLGPSDSGDRPSPSHTLSRGLPVPLPDLTGLF